jgi:capsular exopolysaccharide synthesis family protein
MASLTDALVRYREKNSTGDGLVRSRSTHASSVEASDRPASAISYTQTRVVEVTKAVLRQNRVISGFDTGPIVDAYKIMCIQALQRLRARGGNALAVVSPGEDEGKTLTAINLGLSLAQEIDHTVLLVDANLRAPSVHRYFGFSPEFGLRDYLLDGAPLDKILVNPGIDRFVILPGSGPLVNSAEMLGSKKMAKLVEELKARYRSRLVIFDLPPVLSVADALAFTPYVDAAIMVVQERKTRREDIVRTAEVLKSIELIGTVLNRSAAITGDPEAAPTRRGWMKRLLGRRG